MAIKIDNNPLLHAIDLVIRQLKNDEKPEEHLAELAEMVRPLADFLNITELEAFAFSLIFYLQVTDQFPNLGAINNLLGGTLNFRYAIKSTIEYNLCLKRRLIKRCQPAGTVVNWYKINGSVEKAIIYHDAELFISLNETVIPEKFIADIYSIIEPEINSLAECDNISDKLLVYISSAECSMKEWLKEYPLNADEELILLVVMASELCSINSVTIAELINLLFKGSPKMFLYKNLFEKRALTLYRLKIIEFREERIFASKKTMERLFAVFDSFHLININNNNNESTSEIAP